MLVGTSAVGLRDLVSTPLRPGLPGVQVHAEIIDQIVVAAHSSPARLGGRRWRSSRRSLLASAAGFPAVAVDIGQRACGRLRPVAKHGRRLAGGFRAQPARLADPARADLPAGLWHGIRRQAAALRKREPLHQERLQQISVAGHGAAAGRQSAKPGARRREPRADAAVLRHPLLHQHFRSPWRQPNSPSSSTIS